MSTLAPSTTYRYALRIDLDGVDAPAVAAFLGQHSDSHLVVREGGDDNPHTHAYLTSDKKLPAMRKAVQRFLSGDRGNASYSLKLCADDYSGYLRYMCKGESSGDLPDVVGRCGLEYTDEWVKTQHEEFWVNNVAITKARQKRKGMSGPTLLDQLEERVKERRVSWEKKTDLAREYIRMYKEMKKPINIHHARAVINTLQVVLCPDDSAIDALALQIAPDGDFFPAL